MILQDLKQPFSDTAHDIAVESTLIYIEGSPAVKSLHLRCWSQFETQKDKFFFFPYSRLHFAYTVTVQRGSYLQVALAVRRIMERVFDDNAAMITASALGMQPLAHQATSKPFS